MNPTTLPHDMLLPARTIAGRGAVRQFAALASAFGPRGLLVHGASLRRSGTIDSLLAGPTPPPASIATWEHAGGEPTLDQLATLLRDVHRIGPDWIAALGGGSVLDLAKAAAGLFRAARPLEAYHNGAPVEADGLPFIAIPATAGTGSEATPNAVLTNARARIKKSIRDERLMARLVILDPGLLATCPPATIAAAGMDAMTQAIEAYISRGRTWFSDTIALKATRLIASALPRVFRDPAAPAADDLLLGSYLAGIALCQARLGVVHGLVHPLGALYGVPHGLACAVCLPLALELNRTAIGERYGILSTQLGGDPVETVAALLREMSVVSPFAGQPLRDVEAIVEQTLASASARANPKPVTRDDVVWMLTRLFNPPPG